MSVRQQRRAANQAARLQEKVRRSRGPADEAAITWDKVRAAIAGDRDQVRQANRFKRINRLLEGFLTEIQSGDPQ
jgi:hypothetical protein